MWNLCFFEQFHQTVPCTTNSKNSRLGVSSLEILRNSYCIRTYEIVCSILQTCTTFQSSAVLNLSIKSTIRLCSSRYIHRKKHQIPYASIAAFVSTLFPLFRHFSPYYRPNDMNSKNFLFFLLRFVSYVQKLSKTIENTTFLAITLQVIDVRDRRADEHNFYMASLKK